MSYSLTWHVPKRVYICRIFGDVTVQDVSHMARESLEYIRDGDAPVYVITDLRQMKKRPNNISTLKDALALFQEPNLGMIYLIHSDKLANFIATTMAQISRKELRAYRDPTRAIEVLQKFDPTLPTIPAYPSDYASTE